MTNFSKDGMNTYQLTYAQRLCSDKASNTIADQLISLAVVEIFLGITAFLGNAPIQVALHKESSLHPPTKLLLRTLSASDLCVALIVEPLFAAFLLSLVKERWNICHSIVNTAFPIGFFFSVVSFLILTVISVDRLLALLLGLRYRQVVTLKRTWVTVITICVLSIIPSTMYFWNENISKWCGIIVTSLGLLISAFSYTKIFLRLRHHQSQIQDHQQQPSLTGQLNIARYKNAVYSALWLQLILVVCYLPYGIIVQVLSMIQEFSSTMYLAAYIALTLGFLNSSLNPILYCWKIREVRQAVKDTVRHML